MKPRTKPIRQKSIFQAIEDVQGLTTMGLRKGRDNILAYLKQAGIDHNTLHVFHVTGTNGKGSVCQMISQVLWKGFQKKVGLFTSPHLVNITERFQINGVQISEEQLDGYYRMILDQSKQWNIALSFFEIQVITAVVYFLDECVDYAVIEVGMGGRYDGTNIWSQPLATYVTSIALEHTNVLGATRESILRNKIAIAKPGRPLFTPFQNKIIDSYCARIGAKHISIKSDPMEDNITNLSGKHQIRNATLVLKSLTCLGFDADTIRASLLHIYVPGRLEWVQENILVDTANNRESLQSVIRTLGDDFFRQKNRTVVFGSTQLETEYIRKLIAMIPSSQIVSVGGFHRAHDPEAYSNQNPQIQGMYPTIKAFFESEYSSNAQYFFCGSLYLVGEVIAFLKDKK